MDTLIEQPVNKDWKTIATTFKEIINAYKLALNVVGHNLCRQNKLSKQMWKFMRCLTGELLPLLDGIYCDNISNDYFVANGFVFYDSSFVLDYTPKYNNVVTNKKKTNMLNEDDIMIVKDFFEKTSNYVTYLEGDFIEQFYVTPQQENKLATLIDNIECNLCISKRYLKRL